MEIRTKAVVFYEKGKRSAREIGETYNISERTVRRWGKSHRQDKEKRLRPKKTRPKRSSRATSSSLEQRIIRLKEKYPAWGAWRIMHQFNLPCSWRTPLVSSRNMDFSFALRQATTSRQTIPETACRQHVAGRYIPVPHPGRRKLKNTVLNWSSAGHTSHVAAARSNGITRRSNRNWSVSRSSAL
jgi:transposase